MAFPKVPDFSKSKIDKAGIALAADESLEEARDILNEWRACHAYPINTFQKTLRDKLSKINVTENSIVAQRLKRAPTIIDKLRRYPKMKLSRMQDIGGVRAVVDSIDEVRALEKVYKEKSKHGRFDHKLVGEKDYITSPRSEDGYRSLHLIYSYNNQAAPDYEGLLIEMQIRTKLQHTWATTVETMGAYLNQPLKSRMGEKEWIDFFALASSAFAHMERLPLVPRFSNLSAEETYKAVAKAEEELQILEKLTGFAIAADSITKNKGKGFYHLIILDIPGKSVKIETYTREKFNDAKSAYAAIEKKVVEGAKIEPVLVAAGSIKSLQRAYPNFFLDATEFVRKVREIIRSASSGSR